MMWRGLGSIWEFEEKKEKRRYEGDRQFDISDGACATSFPLSLTYVMIQCSGHKEGMHACIHFVQPPKPLAKLYVEKRSTYIIPLFWTLTKVIYLHILHTHPVLLSGSYIHTVLQSPNDASLTWAI